MKKSEISLKKLFLLLLLMLQCTAVTAKIITANEKFSLILNEEEKTWLAEHKNIRVGIDAAYAPYSYRDNNGQYVGLAVDYLQLLGKQLNVNFEIVPDLSWPQIVEGVKKHSLDVIATAAITSKREEFLAFSEIYIPTPLIIMSRANDQHITTAKDLSGKKVALVKGYSSTEKVIRESENIEQYQVDTVQDGLRAVATGNADAFVGVLGVSVYQARKAGLFNLKVAAPYDKSKNGQRLAVRKDWALLATIFNKALSAMPESVHISLNRKWVSVEQVPKIRRPASLEFRLTPSEKQWLDSHPVVRIGIDSEWAPVEFVNESGEYSGISRDYIEQLEKLLAIRFEVIKTDSWIGTMEKIQTGAIDLLPAITPTEQRQEYLDFTERYLSLPIMLFADQDAEYIDRLSDLLGKKVAVVKQYATDDFLTLNHPELDLVRVANTSEGLSMVANGEVTAFVGNMVTTGFYLGKLGYSQIKIAGETPYRLKVSMAVNKDKIMLLSIMNKAIAAISEDQRVLIYRRWVALKYEHGFDYSLLWKVLAVVAVVFILFSYWNWRLKKLQENLEHVNEDLQNANIKLRELDRLKSMFIASVSHELRTPLNSIIGFSGMMKQGAFGNLNDKYQDYISRINKSGQHLLGLITDIIDISKIESGRVDVELSDFLLGEIVNEGVETIRKQAEDKGLVLEVEMPEGISMSTDRRRLFQCVLNFLSNAMKFTEQGRISIVVKAENDDILINVRDTGIGIGTDDQSLLFEAFERVDTHLRVKAGGTGLGLYLTKKIAEELLQGEVGMESKEGEGSLFWIRVPKVLKPETTVIAG